jgi:hypothetical protein
MKLLPVIFSDKIIFSNAFDRTTLAMALLLMGFLLMAYSIIVLRGKRLGKERKVKVALVGSGLEAGAYQDALKILDRARADSLKILGRAQSKAQSVLNSTYIISKESREKLDDNLRNIYEKQEQTLAALTKDLLSSYKNTVEEGKEENIRTLYEATESMKKGALEGVTEFKEAIKKKTLEASGELESKIEAEYVNVEKEIEAYKSERLNNLNNKIFDILANVYAEVIGQDLDQIKHEKLILGMLKDELRKSGIRNTPRPGLDK